MAHTKARSKSPKQTKDSSKITKKAKVRSRKVSSNNPSQLSLLKEEIKKIETKGKPRSQRKLSFLKTTKESSPKIGRRTEGPILPTSIEFMTEENYNPFPDYFLAQFANGYVIQASERFDKSQFSKSGIYK